MSIWKIWCDGSCGPTNPGPCAWGSVIQSPDGLRSEHCGFIQKRGTNNIAELTAAIESLRKVPEGAEVILCSDSQYVLKGLNEWMPKWTKKAGKPGMNQSLWQIKVKQKVKQQALLKDKNLNKVQSYQFRLTFQDIFTIRNRHQGATLLKAWLENAKTSGLLPIIKLAYAIINHWDGILRWFDSQINNGNLDAFNASSNPPRRKLGVTVPTRTLSK